MKRLQPLLFGLLVGLAGGFLLFRRLLLGDGLSVVWGNDFDPRLISWIAEWGYHSLFQARDVANFFNANEFYPNNNTLAYSDSLLTLQLVYGPLRMLRVPQLAALYLTLAASCVAACMLTAAALNRIGGFTLVEKTIIIVAAHFGLHITGFLVHYQLFGFQFAPPFFLFLFLYVTRWGLRDLAALCLIFALGACFAVYLAPMLCLVGLAAAVPVALFTVRRRGMRRFFSVTVPGSMAIVAVTAFCLYVAQFRPYFSIADDFSPQSFEESAVYSGRPSSLFTGVTHHSKWYGSSVTLNVGDWERAYFPGYILLFGSLPMMVLFVLSLRRRRVAPHADRAGQGTGPKDNLLLGFALLLFAAALVFSWGPYLSGNGTKLPFFYVSELFMGFRSLRAPGRFGMFLGLPLAIFAIGFLRAAGSLLPRPRVVEVFFLAALIIEVLPLYPTFPLPAERTDVYEHVSRQIEEGTPLLELPLAVGDHFATLKNVMRQLNASTFHWGKLVVGYGGKSTPWHNEIISIDQGVVQGALQPSAILDFCRRLHIRHILIRKDLYGAETAGKLRAFLTSEASILFENDASFLARLD